MPRNIFSLTEFCIPRSASAWSPLMRVWIFVFLLKILKTDSLEKIIPEVVEVVKEYKDEKERRMKEASVSLAGLKVAHDITEIGEGDTILTLRVW